MNGSTATSSAVPGSLRCRIFLRKPLGNVPKTDAVSQTLLDIEQLAPKNAFVALTSIDNNNPKFVGGFHFRGSQEEAERIIGKWRSMLMGQNSSLKRDKVQYRRPRNRGDQNGFIHYRDRV